MYPLALSLSSLFHHLRIPIQFFSLACVYFRLFKFTRHICTHTNTNTKRKGPVDANVLSGRTAKPDSVCLWRVGGSIYTSSLHRQFTQYTFGKKKNMYKPTPTPCTYILSNLIRLFIRSLFFLSTGTLGHELSFIQVFFLYFPSPFPISHLNFDAENWIS